MTRRSGFAVNPLIHDAADAFVAALRDGDSLRGDHTGGRPPASFTGGAPDEPRALDHVPRAQR